MSEAVGDDLDHVWLKRYSSPLIIAGPCSAETETQILQTAHELKKVKPVSLFRAGIWKPRTRPGNFEGVGEIGLEWLKKVKSETGLAVTTEVALPRHVDLCLKAGIDVLWIGARTTVNPIMVQELANALRGTNIPVMVKNPVNPDLELWLGAFERFLSCGVNKLAAIHRGFSIPDSRPYRNSPDWQIPLQLKSLFPELPLICDPSHIAGNTELLFPIIQQALDLQIDGLMIESHMDPLNALTDAKQQITPGRLEELLSELNIGE